MGSWREPGQSGSGFLSESTFQSLPTPPAKQEEYKKMFFPKSQWKVVFNQHNPEGGC